MPDTSAPTLTAERYYDGVTEATARLAGVVAEADETLPIPTCPDWTLRQLTTHVGRAQRWAAEIVARRSAQAVPLREVPDGRLPDDPAARPDWLTAGAARLTESVRAGGSDLVWTLTGGGPASFWGRRMAHETGIHSADAVLAAGRGYDSPADLAADGISEFLGFRALVPGDVAQPLPAEGQTLHLHATDPGLDGGLGEWLVTRTADGLSVRAGHAKADVAVRGPAATLHLVIMRRLPVTSPGVEVLGDAALFDYWLAHTAF